VQSLGLPEAIFFPTLKMNEPTEQHCRTLLVAGAAAAEGFDSRFDSQRSKMLTRLGSIRSAVMAKSRQPAVARAYSTTLTQPAR
jgi:hypothetical protein